MRKLIFLMLFMGWPVTGLADEISGDWCSDSGAHVNIKGDQIRTPGGQMITGNYDRHSFEFLMPEGEDAADLTVLLQQLSEEQVRVTYEGREPEIWHRCDMVS